MYFGDVHLHPACVGIGTLTVSHFTIAVGHSIIEAVRARVEFAICLRTSVPVFPTSYKTLIMSARDWCGGVSGTCRPESAQSGVL